MMIRLLAYSSLLFFMCSPAAAAEWHGISPGSSTRADVVREFGECSPTKYYCEFNLPDEDVYITLSGPSSCPSATEGTVLLVERDFAKEQTFASLSLDQRRFKKFDPTLPRKIGYQGYIDDEAGLLLKAFNNKIFQIAYIPELTSRRICPTYYQKPRDLITAYSEHAPPVWIKCPEEKLEADKPLILKAQYNRGLSILLTWHVVGSTIVNGQGRRKITVDTSGLAGRTIEVLVERLDSLGFASSDSCKVSFKP